MRHTNTPPSPLPHAQVTFDIDANGIVNVSARDKGTGKEQQIVIQSSGGLSKDQIEKMVKEAEANAEADKKRKENIEAVNSAESVIHDTEKNLDEFKDDLEPEADSKVREKVQALREYLSQEQDQLSSEEIRKLSGEVQQESLKAFDVAYKKVRGAKRGHGGLHCSPGALVHTIY